MKKQSNVAQALAKLVRGRVADSGDPDYANAVRIDNGRINRLPVVVVVPDSTDDVAAVLKFAKANGITITAKSGGHSATGYCLNGDGIVVDLRELHGLSFDRDSLRMNVGAGTKWKQVYDYMEQSGTGCIPIGGGCPGVGVSGFLLGGGFSFVSRSYGLGADNVTQLTLVTPTGDIRKVNANQAPDLFWACRGGGGGNFGIVTEFEIQTHRPPTESLLAGQITFPFYRIEEILHFYNEWVESLPEQMAIYGYVGFQPDPRKLNTPVLSLKFTPVYNGRFGEGVELLQELIEQNPTSVELHDMTLPEWETFTGSVTLVGGRGAYMRSVVLPARGLDQNVARTLMKFMARSPSAASFLVWTHTGGAISKVGNIETPFPHRASRFVPEVKAIWDASKPEDTRPNVEWAYDFFEELGTNGLGAYVNYIDPLLPHWQSQYYGKNYSRLLKIKRKVDPNNLLSFQQSVGSSFSPSVDRPLDLSPLGRT